MKIELRTVDDTNRNAVVLLEVWDNQKEYIATNEVSLETARSEEYKEIARPFAIYADDKLVGFTMFAFSSNLSQTGTYMLNRNMISSSFISPVSAN